MADTWRTHRDERRRSSPLTANADGTLAGNFTATANGFYRIELDGPAGEKVTASPEYTIDILADQAPSVTLAKPGRDTDATPVQEFFVEARADDDFAVRNLQLVYSVNGGDEKTIGLFSGSKPTPKSRPATRSISRSSACSPATRCPTYARATDNDAVRGPSARRATSTSSASGRSAKTSSRRCRWAAAAAAVAPAPRSARCRSSSARSSPARSRCSAIARRWAPTRSGRALVVLALSQSRLREQVEGLVERMNSRLVTPDPAFKKIAEVLPQAAAEMKTAEGKLQAQSAEAGAAAGEQGAAVPAAGRRGIRAAGADEAQRRRRWRRRRRRLDRRGPGRLVQARTGQDGQPVRDQPAGHAAERRSADRRAGREAARAGAPAGAGAAAPAAAGRRAGAASKRAAAICSARWRSRPKEAARQLERLSREQNRPDLREAARQMQQAADAMRRAAANGDPSAPVRRRRRAAARGAASAAGRAGCARRARHQGRTAPGRGDSRANSARSPSEVRNWPRAGPSGAEAQTLGQRKDRARAEGGRAREVSSIAPPARSRARRDASRKVQEAAGQIRDDKIKEKLHYSRQLIGGSTGSSGVRPHARRAARSQHRRRAPASSMKPPRARPERT